MDVYKKNIWLINQYAMPPQYESRLRTIKFAHYLQKAGYEVTIFASSIMHNMNINLIQNNCLYIKRQYNDLNFIHIKTKKYRKNGVARLIGLLQFPVRIKKVSKEITPPDIIIQTATVPFGNILCRMARKMGAKYIVEVLDLWPQTFVDLKIISPKNPFIVLSYLAEKWLYERADQIIFSMEGGIDYIREKKWNIESGGHINLNKVHYINNGVDLDDYYFNERTYKFADSDLENENYKKVIYIGSIRLANNLKYLINAAKYCLYEKNVKFLLYGDGDEREILESYCKEKEIFNVVFKQKWIEPHYVPYILSRGTVNILNYMPNGFGKYGGSQSKLFQYLASGKPICSNISVPYCLINKYNLGIAKEFTSPKEYADSILSLIYLDENEYNAICIRAKQLARNFDYKNLTKSLINIF